MKLLGLCAAFLAFFITGCSLAGDLTPPPDLVESQSLVISRNEPQATAEETLVPSPEVQPQFSETEFELQRRTIRGQVVNKSVGGIVPDGLQVTLVALEDESEVLTKQTAVDENGEFIFVDVGLRADQIVVVTAEYQGVLYGEQFVQSASEEDDSLTLDIYRTTMDLKNVVVNRLHAIFSESATGTLEVTELWIVSNRGVETVANGSGEGVLEIVLPEGASNLQFESGSVGNRFQIGGSGFVDRSPLRPGEQNHEIVFSFVMAYDKNLDFSQPVQFPVEAIVLLSPESGPELSGTNLQDLGLQELDGISFQIFNTPPQNPGDKLTASVKSISPSQNLTTEILLGGLALTAALVVVRVWWSKRDRNLDGAASNRFVGGAPMLGSQKHLIQRIADLDDALQDGDIDENDHLQQRRELKRKLLLALEEKIDD